jgi:hypothetical protein
MEDVRPRSGRAPGNAFLQGLLFQPVENALAMGALDDLHPFLEINELLG